MIFTNTEPCESFKLLNIFWYSTNNFELCNSFTNDWYRQVKNKGKHSKSRSDLEEIDNDYDVSDDESSLDVRQRATPINVKGIESENEVFESEEEAMKKDDDGMSLESKSIDNVETNPDISEIIDRMISGEAHGVNLKKRGQTNAVYDLRNTDELEELIEFILHPTPGSCWETFMYKSPPESIPKVMKKAIKCIKKSMNQDGCKKSKQTNNNDLYDNDGGNRDSFDVNVKAINKDNKEKKKGMITNGKSWDKGKWNLHKI